MASKFGKLVERLVGAQVFFVPDGSNIGTTELPELTSKTVKPDVTDFEDYNLGRCNTAKYDPKTKDRVREWHKPTGGYTELATKVVITDAFDFTMIDYAEKLFDQMMFGLATEPVDDVEQQAFASQIRHKDGWLYMIRTNEDGTVLCNLTLHSRLELKTIPEDKNDVGSPVLRVTDLADGGALNTIKLNPSDAV